VECLAEGAGPHFHRQVAGAESSEEDEWEEEGEEEEEEEEVNEEHPQSEEEEDADVPDVIHYPAFLFAESLDADVPNVISSPILLVKAFYMHVPVVTWSSALPVSDHH
jgi:hypothetical protein